MNAPIPGDLSPNATFPVKLTVSLPAQCGCTFDITGTGNLPVREELGCTIVTPEELAPFMQGLALGIVRLYGESVIAEQRKTSCTNPDHEAFVAALGKLDLSDASDPTPQ